MEPTDQDPGQGTEQPLEGQPESTPELYDIEYQGQKQQVSLDDLKKGYMMQSD